MESVSPVTTTRRAPLQNREVRRDTRQVQATPPERLHTVEEFIDQLEQAVLERL